MSLLKSPLQLLQLITGERRSVTPLLSLFEVFEVVVGFRTTHDAATVAFFVVRRLGVGAVVNVVGGHIVVIVDVDLLFSVREILGVTGKGQTPTVSLSGIASFFRVFLLDRRCHLGTDVSTRL